MAEGQVQLLIAVAGAVIAMVALLWKISNESVKRDGELHTRINTEKTAATTALAAEVDARKDAIDDVNRDMREYVHRDLLMELVNAQFRAQNTNIDALKQITEQRFIGIERSLKILHQMLERK